MQHTVQDEVLTFQLGRCVDEFGAVVGVQPNGVELMDRAGHGMAGVAETAELPASELVTNAYRHSGGAATLRLRVLDGGRLRISVRDADPYVPPPFDGRRRAPRPVPAEADGGRGLFLVCHCADAWGGHPLGDDLFGTGGKVLWCEAGPSPTAAPVHVGA
ncbi:ATP-binding protein [Streptomyces sp. AHU1]|uniref:ATP-binding protein n=1 Tax=Streptomyces sp. AHU1 TaxID=3377215 RepID=UPI003877C97B